MAKEDWRLCVEWLVRCQALPADHRLAADDAQVFDLAQFIRDGVIICHLLNRLHPGAVDHKDFSQRPQMSQFLCLKNIRIFLTTCRSVFDLRDEELFEPTELFDVRDFGKVINTLSVLSCTREAQKTNIPGFTTKSRIDYHPLHTLAANVPEDNIYDVKYPDDEHVIYEDLCSLRRRTSGQDPVPVTKRDYCIKELVETEKNYIEALNMIIECFIKKLRSRIPEADCEMIFKGIENLYHIHQGFHADLVKACSPRLNSSYTGRGNLTIADCFIKWKEKFLAYGEFCSNLPRVQAALDRLMQNQAMQQHIMDCQKEATGGKFRLRDLLSVPMQRVLKYHLLLKELIKNTDQMHPDRKSLERALDEMQDLSGYVNEVKRDNEMLQTVEEIENSIVDLLMLLKNEKTDDAHFKDYGRLLKDGELRVRRTIEKKDRCLTIFLFDKVMVLCKSRGETYNYKDALILSHHILEEVAPKEKDRFPFLLVHKETRETWTFTAKTQELRAKWIEAIYLAHDNVSPPHSITDQHEFVMASFKEPTICDVCRKLLRGIFFQGYKCQRTNMVVHKACIEKAKDIGGPPSVPPRADRAAPSTPVPLASTRFSKGKVKANTAYHGVPGPPHGQPLTFEENDIFQLVSDEDSIWWQGRINGQEGFFPKSFVIILKSMKHRDSKYLSMCGESDDLSFSFAGHQVPRTPSPRHGEARGVPRHPCSPVPNSPVSPSFCGSGPGSDEFNAYSWFVGELNREEASRMLEKLPNGTFLIRVSNTGNRKGEYALSIKYGTTNPVKHIKLHRNAEGMYYLVDCKMFRGVPELVQYYQLNSLARSFPEVPSVLQLAYKDALLPSPGASDPDVVGYCIAQNDYAPMEPNQIALRAGDKVAILNKSAGNRGWWKGRLNGKVGYFPSEYVAEI